MPAMKTFLALTLALALFAACHSPSASSAAAPPAAAQPEIRYYLIADT